MRSSFEGNFPGGDLPLPLLPQSPGSESPWAFSEIEPTNLIALVPGERPPKLRDAKAVFEKALDRPIRLIQQPPPDDPRLKWIVVLNIDDDDRPIIVWVEPMRPLPDVTIDFLQARACKWAIGLETVLDPYNPLDDQIRLTRMLGRGFPDSPAMLNVNTGGWHTRQELDEVIFREQAPPTESLLWMIHAISADPQPSDRSNLWVYTHGLARCGRPELEMLDVPYSHVGPAMSLLNSLGELLIEAGGMPAPGDPFEIGPGLAVSLQPWREAAQYVDEQSLGSLKRREGHTGEQFTGVRAAVCGAEPVGTYRKIWTWPREALERLMQGAAVYKTARATQKQAFDARATWSDFIAAFEAVGQGRPTSKGQFLVKAGFGHAAGTADPNDADGSMDREHLWFKVLQCAGDRIEGRLMHEPGVIQHMHQGDVVWIDREAVSDWQAELPQGLFSPSRVAELREAVGANPKEEDS